MSKIIWFDNNVRRSSAYRSLSKWAMLVYLDFLSKRQMEQVKAPSSRTSTWVIKNNGEIVFPYSEAVKKGISRSQFCKAIDELIDHGFLDIAHQGSGGRSGDMTKYTIDDRWKEYGTPAFRLPKNPRKKDARKGRGWAAYHAKKSKASITKMIPEKPDSSNETVIPRGVSSKVSNTQNGTSSVQKKKVTDCNNVEDARSRQMLLWSNDLDTIL